MKTIKTVLVVLLFVIINTANIYYISLLNDLFINVTNKHYYIVAIASTIFYIALLVTIKLLKDIKKG